MNGEKKEVAAAADSSCAICGKGLKGAELYFSFERHEKAIYGHCIKEMYPSRLSASGITLEWKFK